MNLTLTVVDSDTKFEVRVMDGERIVITLDWYGGKSNAHSHPFEYQGKFYVVFGPFHEFRDISQYVLYEMTEVARG